MKLLNIVKITLIVSLISLNVNAKDLEALVQNIKNSQELKDSKEKIQNSIPSKNFTADPALKSAIESKRQQLISNKFSDSSKSQAGNLIVFISASLPEDSLRNYYLEAKKYNALLVVRGFINDSFEDSIVYFKQAASQGIAVNVDPYSFKKFNINQVPAIVIKDQYSDSYDKIIGNVTIDYALRKFAEQGQYSRSQALKLLEGGSNES